MIRTFLSAELPESGWLSADERVWSWAALYINAPFFLLEILEDTADGPMTRDVITADIREAIRLREDADPSRELVGAYLLTPAYINGSGSRQLDRLAQVWSAPGNLNDLVFILANLRTMRHCLTDAPARAEDLELVLDFEPAAR